MACRFLSSIESSPLFFHSRPRRREKRWEQCFIFRISWKFKPHGPSQTARGDGGTIRKVRKIFPLTRAGSPVMHQCIFAEGWPCSPPNPAGNGKHKSSHRRKKVGAVFISQIAWKFKPQGLSQTARSNGGTTRKTREIFPAARDSSSVMHRRIFAEGWHHHFPQSRMGWEYKTPTSFAKGGSSVYKSRTNR